MLIDPNPDLAIFALRLALGIVFLAHGPSKIIDSVGKAKKLGMHTGVVWLVGALETVGALSMISGIRSDIGAAFIIIVMLGTIYLKTQKWGKDFTGENGWELDFMVLAAALTVLLAGSTDFNLL